MAHTLKILRRAKDRKSQDSIVFCRLPQMSLLVCVQNQHGYPNVALNLREEVSCPVCSDLIKDPRHLPCLHSFCLPCLKHWHQTSGGQYAFRCPKCQALSRMPASGDLKDLPTSFYLNSMIDVLAIKECSETQVTCGNCEKKSSEASYCLQCCMFYCEQCLIEHNMMRNNKDHRVLAVKEFQDKDYEDVLKRPVFCSRQEHQKKELEYVCKKCEIALWIKYKFGMRGGGGGGRGWGI